MGILVASLRGDFVARVRALDLSRPLDDGDFAQHPAKPPAGSSGTISSPTRSARSFRMWDNRCVLHRGRPWDERRHRRLMHRTTVAGAGPTVIDGRPISVG